MSCFVFTKQQINKPDYRWSFNENCRWLMKHDNFTKKTNMEIEVSTKVNWTRTGPALNNTCT